MTCRCSSIVATVSLLIGMAVCTPSAARGDQQPQKANVKLTIAAHRIKYYSDAAIIQARGNVQVWLSDGVRIDGDVCSINLGLRRFVVAGHVRLQTPAATYTGAAFADFLPFHRAYFIPLEELPDRWTFLNDDWTQPEKGREMPGDAFFLADMSDSKPFITSKRVVIDPDNYVEFSPASFVLLNGGVAAPPLPVYLRNFSDNPNFFVNSLSGASFDIPYGVAGSQASLDTVHFRYDPVRKSYFSFEHHSVAGEQGYAVFSLNPATQAAKQWNLLSYAPTSSSSAVVLNAQLFTFQSGLSRPLSSNGFADLQYTQSLRQSALKFELTQLYDSLLAPTPLGYYGDPSHPFVPNHPIVTALSWSGYDHRLGSSGFSYRLISGLGQMHDNFGVSGTTLRDVQTVYAGAILSTPVYRAPLETTAIGTYQLQHVWLSFPNTADFQTLTISDSKRLSNKFFLTGSLLLQSAVTKNVDETLASPNASTGMVPQPLSPNGLPIVGGVATLFPHVTNSALIVTAAMAPSPSFQFTIVAQTNHYSPVQQPFVAGPPRYQASADARMRISKTLFLDVGRAYYFNWGNQRWSPTFALQVSAQ
ncbi:MAG: hypothetical protein M3Z41_06855 [Candidatus Eremiobacteraeota bacterium]|nr:hypothetical protein [Candidatus Eremiobacteraeota bacterium]